MNPFNQRLQPKVLFVWEIDQTMTEGEYAGKRFVVHKEYTNSLHEKANLRGDVESWKGKSIPEDIAIAGLDLEKFLKVQCTLNIIHKTSQAGRTFPVVAAVMPAQKDAPMLNPELPADWCPPWIKDKIAQAAGGGGDIAEKFEDDVPF